MSEGELTALAEDIRQRIIETCLKQGGHLGASLGPVELAIALHRIFESPREPIIWDVGHQAYAHKLLTGRWERFSTLRQRGGLSGFLSRDESEHDVFGAGHSSTSLSAALAMAWARAHHPGHERDWTVAVIGDGGLTAGLALEALNNLRGQAVGPLLIVLNDNQMSIAPNVGAIPSILASGEARSFLEHFGLDYVGPIDGHQMSLLLGTIEQIKRSPAQRPILLHVHTQKGKGYAPAEERPSAYHGISGIAPALTTQSYSDAFGQALCRIAEEDPRVVAITAAMPEGTGLIEFSRRFPDRFFDVGIAEGHAVTFAAGLAASGFIPVVAIYSTFLQRALDSVIHDVCLQRLPVIFAIDRAGVVGADGPTHHGAFDIAYLGPIPGLIQTAPNGLDDLDPLLRRAIASGSPFALRYPRGTGPSALGGDASRTGWRTLHGSPSAPVWVCALGSTAARARRAAEMLGSEGGGVYVMGVVDAKPTPPALQAVLQAAPEKKLILIEDGSIRGGWGEALLSSLSPRQTQAVLMGYPDRWIPHGSPSQLEDLLGLSADAISERMRSLLHG